MNNVNEEMVEDEMNNFYKINNDPIIIEEMFDDDMNCYVLTGY